jgi:hypothetical protein
LEELIISETRMNVKMKMWHFLEGGLADGVPKAKTFVWKCGADRASHACDRRHKRGSGRTIQLADVLEVVPRNDQGVPRMKLAKIDECNGLLVLIHDTRRNLPRGDIAEDAAGITRAH